MTDSASGRGGPNEAQCYNCGSSGHWAVACPEPTRETPAGLAAWRKSSNVGQGGGKGRAYGSASKRSKGPIITKYTPPPQPSFVPAVSAYGPHPPGPHQPPAPYSAAAGPFQYGAPPPPMPAGYPQPPYPYHMPPYATPAAYGPPRYGHPGPGPMASPPAPPPPSAPFMPGRPGAHDYRPPLPPYAQPFPHAPPSHRSVSAKHSPNRPANVRPEVPPVRSASAPSKPPITRISHPLPPKPPPSHDQVHAQRDHKGKRRFERQHHQDKRHKSFMSTPPRPLPFASPHHVAKDAASANERPPPGDSPARERPDPREIATSIAEDASSLSSEKEAGASKADGGVVKPQDKTVARSDPLLAEALAKLGDQANVEKETQPRPPDEGKPTQAEAATERPCPPSADASGDVTDSADTQDKAKVSSSPSEDGEISSDEDDPGPATDHRDLPEGRWKSPTPLTDTSWKRKRTGLEEAYDDQASPKKTKLGGSADRVKGEVPEDDGVNDGFWDSLEVPRQVDRKRRGSMASLGSRHSSVSSKSSDLNSLEAELLGRPKNQRPSEPSPPPRPRLERRTPPKPKRRQNNTNSAYSRRW